MKNCRAVLSTGKRYIDRGPVFHVTFNGPDRVPLQVLQMIRIVSNDRFPVRVRIGGGGNREEFFTLIYPSFTMAVPYFPFAVTMTDPSGTGSFRGIVFRRFSLFSLQIDMSSQVNDSFVMWGPEMAELQGDIK